MAKSKIVKRPIIPWNIGFHSLIWPSMKKLLNFPLFCRNIYFLHYFVPAVAIARQFHGDVVSNRLIYILFEFSHYRLYRPYTDILYIACEIFSVKNPCSQAHLKNYVVCAFITEMEIWPTGQSLKAPCLLFIYLFILTFLLTFLSYFNFPLLGRMENYPRALWRV